MANGSPVGLLRHSPTISLDHSASSHPPISFSPGLLRSTSFSQPALIVVLVAFNLRGALIALAPVMDQVRRDTSLSTAAAGLLLTLPVLCFAAFSSVAPRLAHRWGIERVLALAMMLLATGVLVRLESNGFALFAGTVTVGAAIALGNRLRASRTPTRPHNVIDALERVRRADTTLNPRTACMIASSVERAPSRDRVANRTVGNVKFLDPGPGRTAPSGAA